MERDKSLLNYAAIGITWLVVCGLSIAVLRDAAGRYEGILPAAIVMQVLILVLMLAITSQRITHGRPQVARFLFAILFVLIIVMAWRTPVGFFFIYTIMWVAIAPFYFSTRTGFILLVMAIASWYIVMKFAWEDVDVVVDVLLLGTFHFFALISSMARQSADAANEKAQQLNRDLMATQSLLASASKQSERTRIARDLHDLLGHHLTALTINLQVAERLVDGQAKEKVEQCHALSKLLLNDVRDAVTAMRDESSVDFAEALKLAVNNVPNLAVNLDIDPALSINDVKIVETLLRCVQEAVTNTLRHSGATECWVAIWKEGDQLRLRINDNGVAEEKYAAGNGLKGMRERVEKLNGDLVIDVLQGLRINIQIPLAA